MSISQMQIEKFKIQRRHWRPRCDLCAVLSDTDIVDIVHYLYALLLWLVSESIFKAETPHTSDRTKRLTLKTR